MTEDADSLHRKKTKRWQNVNPHFKYNITVVIYRTHLNGLRRLPPDTVTIVAEYTKRAINAGYDKVPTADEKNIPSWVK